jgi:hypothetical protein
MAPDLIHARKVRAIFLFQLYAMLCSPKPQITIVIESCYMWATCATKISILLFYRRLATGTINPWFQRSIYLAIFSVVAYLIIFLTGFFWMCRPFNAYWKLADYVWLSLHKGEFQCFNEGALIMSSCIISAVQDFVACGLPLVLFWKLSIPIRQKVVLGMIFSLGLL